MTSRSADGIVLFNVAAGKSRDFRYETWFCFHQTMLCEGEYHECEERGYDESEAMVDRECRQLVAQRLAHACWSEHKHVIVYCKKMIRVRYTV